MNTGDFIVESIEIYMQGETGTIYMFKMKIKIKLRSSNEIEATALFNGHFLISAIRTDGKKMRKSHENYIWKNMRPYMRILRKCSADLVGRVFPANKSVAILTRFI